MTLGDTKPESVRRAEGETVTTASLEALHSYSMAQDLSSTGRQQDSIEHYQKAIALDDKFGRAYSGLATVLFNTRASRRGGCRAGRESLDAHGPHDRA